MPHIIVKLYAGKTDAQKQELTEKITRDVAETTGCTDAAVSVAIEEFQPEDWPEKVYRPDILERPDTLWKAPGYPPFEAEAAEADRADDLTAYVRGAAERAALEDESGMFNPMSGLDIELEDRPESFDPYFDTPWAELADDRKPERLKAIRRVL